MNLQEFGHLLDSMRSGSDGVALFALGPLLSLVTEEESHANMPRGADELVERWAQGQIVAPTAAANAARPDKLDVRSRTTEGPASGVRERAAGSGWFWGALGGAAAVALLWAFRSRSRAPAPPFPELPLAVLEVLLEEPKLTGPQASLIVRRLQSLEPDELELIRTKSLLLHLCKAGGKLRDVELQALDPGGLTIAKAQGAGWISDTDWTWSMTAQGRQFLDLRMSQADSRQWDRFVLARLDESLQVTCPTCGIVLGSLWLQPTLGCPSCHNRFSVEASPAVTVHNRAGSDAPLQKSRAKLA